MPARVQPEDWTGELQKALLLEDAETRMGPGIRCAQPAPDHGGQVDADKVGLARVWSA
jgi:hypothetical protein